MRRNTSQSGLVAPVICLFTKPGCRCLYIEDSKFLPRVKVGIKFINLIKLCFSSPHKFWSRDKHYSCDSGTELPSTLVYDIPSTLLPASFILSSQSRFLPLLLCHQHKQHITSLAERSQTSDKESCTKPSWRGDCLHTINQNTNSNTGKQNLFLNKTKKPFPKQN